MKEEKVVLFHYDKFNRKVCYTCSTRMFETYRVLLLEKSFVENLGTVYYTYNNITKPLDYYNDE